MKKFLVLFSLFVLPLVFYIFLSKGIYKYSNLPILTKEVQNVNNSSTSFAEHLNVVCFLGSNVNTAKASLFNLNQTIYKRYYQKPLFQVTAILPAGTANDYKETFEELSAFTDISKWNFVYKTEAEIKELFNSFETPYSLNENLYSENAYIIDMELRLRGRKDDEDTESGKLYGYNMKSVSTLKNKMKDDIDIIYYQLKKSAEKEARRKREI
ncbi:hypothetical protein SAMN05444411_101559 [Lutibacter oricola]|uniref:Uncharacterized protein n=1 Tax=Lutibacter oricola TaxID=762486 RepID=A0A1H2SW95_9FLAO|nr:hypothetical protein [Lutibacter oricola]SDW35745.1 hypothetical protein SAMN05444411_101559 [Lutibacter oricola]